MNGIVYQANGSNAFKAMTGTSGVIWSLITDDKGTIYAGTPNGVYQANGTDTFKAMTGTSGDIQTLAIDKNGNIYAGSITSGLYKATDKDKFEHLANWPPNNNTISSITIGSDGTIYVANLYAGGIYIINPINLLLDIKQPDTFDKSWSLYNGIVYNNTQKINIKDKLVATATLDNNSITVPTTSLNIAVGEHTLILTLKDKSVASIFGGDTSTGEVTYKLWVKTAIDKNKINYSTNTYDTDLLTGLVSDLGNTNNAQIVQTRIKKGSSPHSATLNLNFDDVLIDYTNSFYVQGTVDDKTNDFTEVGTHQTFSNKIKITTNGIYHLHLVDTVGNTYDSYLELGESNWKLQGKFDDQSLNDKANKLNVTVDSHSASQESKQEANHWLDNYKNLADSTFNSTVLAKGKGFTMSIDSDLKGNYKSFLDAITYVNSKTQYAINQTKLNDEIIKIAELKLKDGLAALPQNLNVDTKNVVNKSTLDSYSSWINNYQKFINDNKNQWINDVVKTVARGFATSKQMQDIKSHIASLDFKNYLKHVIWNPTTGLTTSSDYKQFVELDKLQNETIDWVNKNLPDIDKAYQNAIKEAESGLYLHGYSIDKILNGKSKPQTKDEIDNFVNGQSYHNWLQSQATSKFQQWQLKIGLYISLPILGIIIIVCWFLYLQFSVKHNPARKSVKTNKK